MSYPINYFKNKSVKSKANQIGLIGIENNDLTVQGLVAKAKEWDETEGGIEKYIYNLLKRDIEKKGGKMPKVRQLNENKPEYWLKKNNLGENTMKIKKSELMELIKEVLQEEDGYQEFFKSKLGDRKLDTMSDDEKKQFFLNVDKEWKAKNETLEPVSPADGNPLKRVKAKKRDQLLAQEELVRRIVREELRFVMFADKGNTVGGYKVKKRQIQKDMGV